MHVDYVDDHSQSVTPKVPKSQFDTLECTLEELAILKLLYKNPSIKSVFQHVSFADYQVFSLSENGIQTVFLEKLLEKVFSQNDDNPFYQSYKKEETNCQLCQRCPVRHNFEFLSDPKNQQVLIHRIVQVVIIDKRRLTCFVWCKFICV